MIHLVALLPVHVKHLLHELRIITLLCHYLFDDARGRWLSFLRWGRLPDSDRFLLDNGGLGFDLLHLLHLLYLYRFLLLFVGVDRMPSEVALLVVELAGRLPSKAPDIEGVPAASSFALTAHAAPILPPGDGSRAFEGDSLALLHPRLVTLAVMKEDCTETVELGGDSLLTPLLVLPLKFEK